MENPEKNEENSILLSNFNEDPLEECILPYFYDKNEGELYE